MELIQGEKFVRFQSDNDLKNIRLWMDKNMTILHIGDINDNTSVANAIELLDVTEVRYGCETDTFLDILKRHLKKKNSRSSWLWKKILEYLLWYLTSHQIELNSNFINWLFMKRIDAIEGWYASSDGYQDWRLQGHHHQCHPPIASRWFTWKITSTRRWICSLMTLKRHCSGAKS